MRGIAKKLCAVSLLVAVEPAAAQFGKVKGMWDNMINPEITVTIEHPPSLPLRVKTVAFGETRGEACADSLQSRIVDMFFQSGAEVVDRSRLDAVIAEQRLQSSAMFDQKTATEVGRLLGADALIYVEVHACSTRNWRTEMTCVNYATKQSYVCYKHHTEVTLRGQLRTIDLATGRLLAAKRFETKATESADGGVPPADPVVQQAESQAAGQIRKMFFPWSETRKLVFFDDKECNLKMAHALLRAQDFTGALQQSEQNLEICRGGVGLEKPKVLSHAYYNLGMVHFLMGTFELGVQNLTEAAKLHSSDTITTALAECRNAQQTAAAMERYEEDQQAFLASNGGSGSPPPAALAPAAGNRAPSAAPAKGLAAAPAPAGAKLPIEERLQKLEDLFKKGLITKQDYEKKKAEILADL